MPIDRTKQKEVPQLVPKEPTAAPVDLGRLVIESNERLALVIRDAVEAQHQKKVVIATVERDKDGRLSRIKMEIQ